MSNENFKNNFSWSNSRLSTFESCKRKYYSQYYGFWDGWKDDAPNWVKTVPACVQAGIGVVIRNFF